ncbi:hypothetical protein N9V68_00610 [Octadecabacter sp.]|nr:hypothetical protein [Octadecabacter sp.]
MRVRGALISALALAAVPAWAQTEDTRPLSAIDWLSESVEQPPVVGDAPVLGTQATRTPDAREAPVANSATAPQVSVQPLGSAAPRALGLLPPSATGFPDDLWSGSDGTTLGALLAAEETDTLPALQDLIVTLATARAEPPLEATMPDAFFLARVDKLLGIGALEPAQAMLEAAVPDTSNLFRRWFDVSLLTGTEDAACRSLRSKPDVAPTEAAQIFCLARSGDWAAAVLTLNTGRTLGDIDPATAELLARFLDPDVFEGEPVPEAPRPVTPLTFRMFEAIGAALSTQNLPRAFSHADLRPNVGWKGQLEAAERLARAGAIDDNVLIGLYTSRGLGASGGVMERARTVMQLNTALKDGDPDDITQAVGALVDEAGSVGVIVPLAQFYAPQLMQFAEQSADRDLFEFLLMSDQYEVAALNDDLAQTDPFLAAVARGDPSGVTARGTKNTTVQDAFVTEPDAAMVAMSADGRTGEAILRTIATVQQGVDGDDVAFAEGIATLRALGLEDVARRVALQYLVLK